jgi:hypothetical protein
MPAPCRFMKLWRRGRSGLDDDRAFCKPAPHPTGDPTHDRAIQASAHRNARSAGRAPFHRRGRGGGLPGGALRHRHRFPAREVPRRGAGRRDAAARYRAFYPEIRITTTTYSQVDTRLAFGHVAEPGTYMTTVTRPDLFGNYLRQQIGLLIQNHGVPVYVGPSSTPIPVHFAVLNDAEVQVPQEGAMSFPLRDAFDVPDLQSTHDDIVNGFGFTYEDGSRRAGALHRAAHRLFAGAAGALHRDPAGAFPEPRPVHELPVLHGRVRGLRPRRAGRSRQRYTLARRAGQRCHHRPISR